MGTQHFDWQNGDAHTPDRDNYPWDTSNGYLHGVRVAGVADGAGLEIIKFATVANAVNELTISNSATGLNVALSATGGDTNISLTISPKGAGIINLLNSSTAISIYMNSVNQRITASTTSISMYANNTQMCEFWNGTASVFYKPIRLDDAQLFDSSNNEFLKFTKVASAVNEITISNNSTGNAPSISATGGDTNISIGINGKGSGAVYFGNTATTAIVVKHNQGGTSYIKEVDNGTYLSIQGRQLYFYTGSTLASRWYMNDTGAFIMSANNFIGDLNGNELINFAGTTSAVNELTITNSDTGNSPIISASGGDTNIDIKLNAKGTGVVDFGTPVGVGVAVASTHKVTVKIGGATYYLLASNV